MRPEDMEPERLARLIHDQLAPRLMVTDWPANRLATKLSDESPPLQEALRAKRVAEFAIAYHAAKLSKSPLLPPPGRRRRRWGSLAIWLRDPKSSRGRSQLAMIADTPANRAALRRLGVDLSEFGAESGS